MTRFAIALLVAATLSLPAPAVIADGACVDCHAVLREHALRQPALRLRVDAHRAEDVGCTGCHGGLAIPTAAAHAHSARFEARPVASCIGCHVDEEARTAWEALRSRREVESDSETESATESEVVPSATDAERLVSPPSAYPSSVHAISHLAGGDGATCGDCHVPHGRAATDDPEASIHWSNIPVTCGGCHGSAEIVAGGLPDPLGRWARSVHGDAWAERDDVDGERHAPGCVDCHDPHGGQTGDEAATACGECHAEVRAAFDEGPHREAFVERGFLDCIECHGAHDILAADASLVTAGRESACRRCHARDQEVYAQIGALGEALERADAARRRVETGDDSLRAEASEITTTLVTSVHRLAVDEVESHATALEALAARAPEPPPEVAPAEPDESTAGASRPLTLLGVALLIGVAFAFWRRGGRRR